MVCYNARALVGPDLAQLLLQEISQTVSAPSKLEAELDRVLSQNKLDMGAKFRRLYNSIPGPRM